MTPKKSDREKLASQTGYPRVEPLTGKMRERHGDGTILLPSSTEIDELIRRARKGRLVTLDRIRTALAERHGATMCCPIVTGIHARIAAGAADELEREGRRRITPWWRMLKARGELNEKLPGGLEEQARRLRAEGHTVVARGKRLFVHEFERALARLE